MQTPENVRTQQPRSPGLLAVLLLSLAVASCAPSAGRLSSGAPAAATATQASVSDRLYFGRSIPDGGTVTEQDWATFVREVVTPRFPEGITV